MRAVLLACVQIIIVVVGEALVLALMPPGFMCVAVMVAMIVVAGLTRDSRRVGVVVLVLVLVQIIIIVVGEGVMFARVVAGFMRVPVVVAMIVVAGLTRDSRRVGVVVLAFVLV